MDTTNHRLKNIQGKNSRKFPKPKLEFAGACNCLYNIYIVFTTYVAVQGFLGGSDSKESASNAVGDVGYTVLGMMSNLELI